MVPELIVVPARSNMLPRTVVINSSVALAVDPNFDPKLGVLMLRGKKSSKTSAVVIVDDSLAGDVIELSSQTALQLSAINGDRLYPINFNYEVSKYIQFAFLDKIDQNCTKELIKEWQDTARDYIASVSVDGRFPFYIWDNITIEKEGTEKRVQLYGVNNHNDGAMLGAESKWYQYGGTNSNVGEYGHVTGYEDLGGMTSYVELLRESVEVPIYAPQLYSQNGLRHSKGVIIKGPPGCGKSLICEAVRIENSFHTVTVRCREIIYSDNAVKQLENAFANSKLLIIDDIDIIATAPGITGGASTFLSAQIIHLMARRWPGQIVLATTSQPEYLDPALLGPGLFEREIIITKPDAASQLEILKLLTKDTPLSDDVDLAKIAADSDGLSGAELISLISRSGQLAIREKIRGAAIKIGRREIDDDVIKGMKLRMEHFEEALRYMPANRLDQWKPYTA